MTELYWITRLDSFIGVAIALLVIAAVLFVFLIINWMAEWEELSFSELSDTTRKLIVSSSVTMVITLLILVFVPSEKEAYMIYGIGGTIDYLKENPTAKQLPDKCIKALDNWLDEVTEDSGNNNEVKE